MTTKVLPKFLDQILFEVLMRGYIVQKRDQHLDDASSSSQSSASFPADPYDRMWNRDIFITGEVNVTSDALLNTGMLTKDRPPPAVLKTAVTSTSVNSSLDLYLVILSRNNASVYINWYFSEVTSLKANETRSFFILKDNAILSSIIRPHYENCSELYLSNYSVSSNTTISLIASINSTLPPLINALEVFILGDFPLTEGTNKKDLKAWLPCKKRSVRCKSGPAILVFLNIITGSGSNAAMIQNHE
ncbi:hypothetical protein OROHE_008059 [Orobanche hederae]